MAKKRGKFYMAGTEQTGQYVVLAVGPMGRVGFRDLGGNYRVRVEPSTRKVVSFMKKHFGADWRQPGDGGQFRYSKVVFGEAGCKAALTTALTALGAANARKEVKVNPDAPAWAKELIGPPKKRSHHKAKPVASAEVAAAS